MCGFSARTVAALQALDAPFAAVDILPDPRIRQELSALSQWPTIPQLFVNGELVGGCDIVTEMYESGELAETLGVEQPASRRARGGARRRRAADGHREPPVLSPRGTVAPRYRWRGARAACEVRRPRGRADDDRRPRRGRRPSLWTRRAARRASPPGATSGSCWAPSRSCCCRSGWCSSARCPGSRSGSTGSTVPRSGIAASRSPVWSCWRRTSCWPPTRTAPRSGGRSARSGRSAWSRSRCGRSCRAGSRWCRGRCAASWSPRATPRGCARRAAIFGGYERWRALHRTTGPLRRRGLRARRARRHAVRRRARSCAGATWRSAPSGWASTSTASCWRASSCRCTTTRCRPCARSTRAWSRSRWRRSAGTWSSCPASSP